MAPRRLRHVELRIAVRKWQHEGGGCDAPKRPKGSRWYGCKLLVLNAIHNLPALSNVQRRGV